MTCQPPPEHEGELLHWLQNGEKWTVAMWDLDEWITLGQGAWSPEEAAARGWHWRSVAAPPAEFERRVELGMLGAAQAYFGVLDDLPSKALARFKDDQKVRDLVEAVLRASDAAGKEG